MDNIIGAVASPNNDLTIPTAMGHFVDITRGLAGGLFLLFFIAEALRLQNVAVTDAFDGQGEKPRFGGFLWRTLWIFLACRPTFYDWIFLKMVSLADVIALAIGSPDQWVSLIESLKAQSNASVPFMHITFPTLLGAAALTVLQFVEDVFTMIRYVILCLLYAIGPISLACGISRLGLGAIGGWFRNTWQVAWWLVMFSLVKAAVVPLGLNALGSGLVSGVSQAIIDAVAIIAMIGMIPALTAALFSEANLGAVASAAIDMSAGVGAWAAAKSAGAVADKAGPMKNALTSAVGAGWTALKAGPSGEIDHSGAPKGPQTRSGAAVTAAWQDLKNTWNSRTR